ncbi:MAG: hypothetical protein AAGG02_03535 [Cyanobacteria bacterium P01_H01_bin.15]
MEFSEKSFFLREATQKGLRIGEERARTEIAEKLLLRGMKPREVVSITELPLEKVKAIAKNIVPSNLSQKKLRDKIRFGLTGND